MTSKNYGDLGLQQILKGLGSTTPLQETKKITLTPEQVTRINSFLTEKINSFYDFKELGITKVEIDIQNIILDRDAHLSVYPTINVIWIDSDRYRFNEVLLTNPEWTVFAFDPNLNG